MFSETFARIIFSPLGAFIFWTCKGYRGKFEDEFTKEKSSRNYGMGIFVFIVIGVVIGFLSLKRQPK